MGESTRPPLKVRFDRRVRLEFRGDTITPDAGLLAASHLHSELPASGGRAACQSDGHCPLGSTAPVDGGG